MTKEDSMAAEEPGLSLPAARSRVAYAGRIRELAENLMLRQNPSEVSPEKARLMVESANTFYEALDETLVEAAQLVEQEQQKEKTP